MFHMTLTEKTAYLKGLMEGLNLKKDSDEGKLFSAILDTLNDMALTISDMDQELDVINEELDAIGDELTDVEEDIYPVPTVPAAQSLLFAHTMQCCRRSADR